jgi:hypothetical protein
MLNHIMPDLVVHCRLYIVRISHRQDDAPSASFEKAGEYEAIDLVLEPPSLPPRIPLHSSPLPQSSMRLVNWSSVALAPLRLSPICRRSSTMPSFHVRLSAKQ